MGSETPSTKAVAVVGLWCAGILMSALAGSLVADNWESRYPGVIWTSSDSVIWASAVVSSLLLVSVGAWLAWRMDRNPIGWWLALAGLAFASWIVALYWSHPAGAWISMALPSVFRVLVVLAILGWPSGRFEPRWRRVLLVALAAYALAGLVAPFIGALDETPPWDRADWLLPALGGRSVGALRKAIFGIGFLVVAPTALLVAVARRRSRLPVALRSMSTPAYAAAWVLAVADYWLFLSHVLGAQLEVFDDGGTTPIGTLRAVVDFGRFGAVAVLLLVGYRIRRQTLAGRLVQPGEVDVGALMAHDSINRRVSALCGVEGVQVLFHRPDGGWVDGEGRVEPGPSAGRSMPILDRRGEPIAALGLPAGTAVAPTIVEAVAANIRLDLIRARRSAAAAARLAELRELQRGVLDLQDDARRRLERDLHDGVQQRLVALTLDVALAERAACNGGRGGAEPTHDQVVRDQLATSLLEATTEVRQLVDRDQPAVLDAGLAGALTTLASSVALPTELVLHRDLPPGHPATRALWFAASEAIGNAMKHAEAQRLRIVLSGDQERTVLQVADDGRGGLTRPPATISTRVTGIGGSVSVESPTGGGTTVTITVPTREQVV